jgi:hypothetical protein
MASMTDLEAPLFIDSTALDGWAISPKNIPDYNDFQQIVGTAVYIAIVVIAIGIVIFMIRRRR